MGYFVRVTTGATNDDSTWLGRGRVRVLAFRRAQYYPHPTAAIEAAHGWFKKEESAGVEAVEIVTPARDPKNPYLVRLWRVYARPKPFEEGDEVRLAPLCGMRAYTRERSTSHIKSLRVEGNINLVKLTTPLAGCTVHSVLHLRHAGESHVR